MTADTVGPAGRGATTIADRVVAKIAAKAAREALGVLPQGGSAPLASVVVQRDAARVSINLELGYPSDLRGQCLAVRSQVIRRVRDLAGLEVPEVAVHVERLRSPRTARESGGRELR
ncbi:Asp23/Gls24 family envelope stress response protein [Streptomyces sp. NPDC048350]|uniref:Asp23/Gls24 family envelope stress response protein n=1 Tax=Streptomyces sp. NPDC048350 TaxID=3365538 RepID=UPI0037155775